MLLQGFRMKEFLDSDFLLSNESAIRLFHDYAEKLPIIDYHNHLSPEAIASDYHFRSITEAWLAGDHYKWRVMRINGVNEKYCTGDASDIEKFEKWAETVPYTVRNPLYHWTHLELKRYFDINQLLTKESSADVYEQSTEQLQEKGTNKLLSMMDVQVVCTTDDPVDDLYHHQTWKKSGNSMKMLPAFRPDKVLDIGRVDVWNAYVDRLEESSGMAINSYQDLLDSLSNRHGFFHSQGCRLADHGLNHTFAEDFTEQSVIDCFNRIRNGKPVDEHRQDLFRSAILYELALLNYKKGWTQQYHLGALRNNNPRMYRSLGPDTGFDSIGDFAQARSLSKFLGKLDTEDQLAKTILYNLNPADNAMMATMAGNFNDGSTPGKVQFGAAWWFLDQKDGIVDQLNVLSNMGLVSRFVGMLTDSRSFLSFPRHEYFRRILCDLFGQDIERGELPNDPEWIGKIIQDICYNNANGFFNFTKEDV